MAVFDTFDGALPAGHHPPPSLSPIDRLRCQIGVMADCQTRLLDALGRADQAERPDPGADTNHFLECHELPCIRKQLVHLGQAFEQACGIVMAMEDSAEPGPVDVADFDPEKIIELAQPWIDGGQTGGGA